jgi:hypothetical protein
MIPIINELYGLKPEPDMNTLSLHGHVKEFHPVAAAPRSHLIQQVTKYKKYPIRKMPMK